MAKYEIMYIVKANLEEEAIKTLIAEGNDLLVKNGAKVLEVKEYGLRDLAYEINHNKKGYYVWLSVEADGNACKEFTRRANINEKIIRHIVVREEE